MLSIFNRCVVACVFLTTGLIAILTLTGSANTSVSDPMALGFTYTLLSAISLYFLVNNVQNFLLRGAAPWALLMMHALTYSIVRGFGIETVSSLLTLSTVAVAVHIYLTFERHDA